MAVRFLILKDDGYYKYAQVPQSVFIPRLARQVTSLENVQNLTYRQCACMAALSDSLLIHTLF